jgi:hypothetical protein
MDEVVCKVSGRDKPCLVDIDKGVQPVLKSYRARTLVISLTGQLRREIGLYAFGVQASSFFLTRTM